MTLDELFTKHGLTKEQVSKAMNEILKTSFEDVVAKVEKTGFPPNIQMIILGEVVIRMSGHVYLTMRDYNGMPIEGFLESIAKYVKVDDEFGEPPPDDVTQKGNA